MAGVDPFSVTAIRRVILDFYDSKLTRPYFGQWICETAAKLPEDASEEAKGIVRKAEELWSQYAQGECGLTELKRLLVVL